MIVVIQCAASKRSGAGYILSAEGKPVHFVPDPEAAPAVRGIVVGAGLEFPGWGQESVDRSDCFGPFASRE